MGCIVSKRFLDFYIFFIFTRPLRRYMHALIQHCFIQQVFSEAVLFGNAP